MKSGEEKRDLVQGIKWTIAKVLYCGTRAVVRVQALGSDYFTTVTAAEWAEL